MSLQAKAAVTHSPSAISLTYSGTLSPVMTVISRKLSSHQVHEPRGQTFLEGFLGIMENPVPPCASAWGPRNSPQALPDAGYGSRTGCVWVMAH